MTRKTRSFIDLDLNFIKHPVTGDVSERFDENAIKTSVKNLILTKNFERPFHSNIGTQIKSLLFELPSPMLSLTLKRAIVDTITNFEPRVALDDVQVLYSADNNSIYVTIRFHIVNTEKPLVLDVTLERTR
jgi:phage baseplate assembly protein W